ncbi:hypothetical protein TWF696_000281 [Orbilia brochopaga]|uniref:C2H2-type domain-containing protein n=1 Tax=Orbilia brochopaga TaxID=3140254 RepID=A0AAV9VDL0_9PEZI
MSSAVTKRRAVAVDIPLTDDSHLDFLEDADITNIYLNLPSSQATVKDKGSQAQNAFCPIEYSGLRDTGVVSTSTSLGYAAPGLPLSFDDPALPNEVEPDFILFENAAGLPEPPFWPEPSPSMNSWTTSTSPSSFALSEDALGSPQLSSRRSKLSAIPDEGRKPAQGESIILLAAKRMQEDDEGFYRRKAPATVGHKRKRSQSSDEPPGDEQPGKKPKGTKRPRPPKYICETPGCEEAFTRKRSFEMHLGEVHNKPLFRCEICKSLGTRNDNSKVHEKSKKHLKNLRKLAEAAEAEAEAAATAAAAMATASSADRSLDLGAAGADIDSSSKKES